MRNLCRVNILGVGISAVTMAQALEQISGWIEQRSRQYVSVCTVHTVMECQRDAAMRQAIKGAGLAAPDGMPLVWLGRWLSESGPGQAPSKSSPGANQSGGYPIG